VIFKALVGRFHSAIDFGLRKTQEEIPLKKEGLVKIQIRRVQNE